MGMIRKITSYGAVVQPIAMAGSCAAVMSLLWAYQTAMVLPAPWVIAAFVLVSLLTLYLDGQLLAERYIAFDRLTQVALVLIFGPYTAAIVAVIAYLIWPFLYWSRADFSLRTATLHALHGVGMAPMAILAGGYLYYWAGGQSSLVRLTPSVIAALVLLVLGTQLVAFLLRSLRLWAWRESLNAALSPLVNVVEMAMLPLAVLVAIFYRDLPAGGFLLLILLQCLMALMMYKFLRQATSADKRSQQMIAVQRVTEAVNASLPLGDLAQLVYRECHKLIRFTDFQLVVYDHRTRLLDVVLHQRRAKRAPRRQLPASAGLLGWVVENNKPTLIEDWEHEEHDDLTRRGTLTGEPPRCWLGVPVGFHGRILGAVGLQNSEAHTLRRAELEIVMTLAAQVGAAMVNASLFKELEGYRRDLEQKVAERTESLRRANAAKESLLSELQRKTQALDRLSKEDSLTGLFNRRYMDARLDEELARAERLDRNIAVAMTDLDCFKDINDTFSHSVGDEVLRVTAAVLRDACRSIDIVARYGGEEFLICFPETDLDRAIIVCERIRKNLRDYPWGSVQPGLEVTMSLGVAGGTLYDKTELQKNADQLLYKAKQLGRDRVCS